MEKLLLYTGKDIQKITMDAWLKDKAPELRPIVLKWFDEIKNCGEDVQGIFHDGYPIGCVENAPFAYVNAFTSHVNVGFFYGASLYDKNGLLEGTGKNMRHVKIKPGVSYAEIEIKILIKAAYGDIKRRLREI